MAGRQELSLGRGMALVAPGFVLVLFGALCSVPSVVWCLVACHSVLWACYFIEIGNMK